MTSLYMPVLCILFEHDMAFLLVSTGCVVSSPLQLSGSAFAQLWTFRAYQ